MTLLKGWKEISAHLDVSVSTAKRYRKVHEFPVKYLPSGKPCIYVEEIMKWLEKLEENKKIRNGNKIKHISARKNIFEKK